MDFKENLTHEEIWDDSALINSWNHALEEYKTYHSIHLNGGTVDDLPDRQEEKKTLPDAKQETNGEEEPTGEDEQEQEREDESEPMDVSDETSNPTISDTQQSAAKKTQAEGGSGVDGWSATTGHGPGPGPQVLLGSIQDDELKKLLMSWYYAGYYTGLYEGKQQGLQQAEEARRSS